MQDSAPESHGMLKGKAQGRKLGVEHEEVHYKSAKNLVFLGAKWCPLSITRDNKNTSFVRDLTASLITTDPRGRKLQRIRGNLNLVIN